MASVRVLIVDDEALARQRVRRLLQNEADVEIVGEAETGRDAVRLINELHPDLVCLDVQMPELDGFGVLRELEGGRVPMVLFITAYDEHAQRAFDVHAVDYVLKPVDADRFRAAFERLPERDRKVAVLLYVHDLTLREIGEILGVTESRVCQIHGQLKRTLRQQLRADEALFSEVA